jgi:hypothetical protein
VKPSLVACLLLVSVRVPLLPGQAQPDTLARIVGTVRSSINGLPINGVMVAVRGARAFAVSDSSGAFTIAGLPSGRQTIRILYRDSLSYEQEVKLKRGKTLTLSVLLDVAAGHPASRATRRVRGRTTLGAARRDRGRTTRCAAR